jgi:hypothetical protein
MTHTFDRRLRKLEARTGSAQDFSHMSDEELEASLGQDIQDLVNTLSQGTKQQQAVARMLEGRRASHLKPHELDELLELLQGGLAAE